MTTAELPDSLIATLPGDYYTDEAIFALEQQRILERMWFCAVRADDLADAGCVPHGAGRARERARSPATATGEVRAFFNVCRHRGVAHLHRPSRARSSAPSSARTTPGPTTSTAS